ncbi:MAG: hypothetical protein KU37_06110 [Sulfuricurvum sp. PC08-66]|nr:MAG: hypothetical protein KU37_06110 [Sulfuricurvum sp. PC08-66]
MIQNAHAKVNLFLKITGTRGAYHEMVSRFLRVETLFDTLHFLPRPMGEHFELEGDFGCALEKNTIYKAYQALLAFTKNSDLQDFFALHKVVVEKRIPTFAGLGGGSSDAATFLRMANHYAQLGLDVPTLAYIGSTVGADIPFFIYDVAAANVEGIGEIVTPIDEAPLYIETFTPPIACDTAAVFREFRAHHFHTLPPDEIEKYLNMPSLEAYESLSTQEANDLYAPAVALYGDLAHYNREGYRFSGSGSSFFRILHG